MIDFKSKLKVDVLVATYNGEKYILEQLNSILLQERFINKIILRDDGSQDSTQRILNNFRDKNPNLVKIIEDGKGQLGPKNNFKELVLNSEAELIVLSDQDDLWSADKLEKLLAIAETKNFMTEPVLVHSDLKVVNKKLSVIADSFMDYKGFDPSDRNPLNLLLRNTITGCTVLCNRVLIKQTIDYFDLFSMHDEALAVCAALSDNIYYVNEKLVLYRQHDNNVVGAHAKNGSSSLLKTKIASYRYDWISVYKKAQLLSNSKFVSHNNKILLEQLISISTYSFVNKLLYLYRDLPKLKLNKVNTERLKRAYFTKHVSQIVE